MINTCLDLVCSHDVMQCGRCGTVAEPPREVREYRCGCAEPFYVVLCSACSGSLLSAPPLQRWAFRARCGDGTGDFGA